MDAENPEDLVLESTDGFVRTITLNRPHRMNATTPAMRERLFRLLDQADREPGVRCIVVTGRGRGFWPGEDRAELSVVNAAVVAEQIRSQPVSYDLPSKMRTPIVAAVNGAVAGVGFSFVLQADIRVAARGAKWAAPFAGLGLVAEAGMSWTLPRHVGWGNAMEIMLTADPILSEDAYRMGLVQHLEDAEDVLPTAQRLAHRIARNSPFSITNIREQARLDWSRSFQDGYADGGRRALVSLDREDFHRAVAAAIEKREVTFE